MGSDEARFFITYPIHIGEYVPNVIFDVSSSPRSAQFFCGYKVFQTKLIDMVVYLLPRAKYAL